MDSGSSGIFSIQISAFSIPILTLGNGWLVADKPCELSVHNDPGHDLCTILFNRLQSDPGLRRDLACRPEYGLHAVNRLDKQTSGVILMACRPEVFRDLAEQFETRRVKKQYRAIVHGNLCASRNPGEWHLWTWPLADSAGGRRNPTGSGKLRRCSTRYRVVRHTAHYSLIACEPLTGRKHQIRRHAKLAGHPVVGDRRYGSRRALKFLEQRYNFQRLGLHCRAITIHPPGDTQPRTFQSTLPSQIQQLLDNDLEMATDGKQTDL